MTTLRCPTCGQTVVVAVAVKSASCAHRGTPHDARKPTPMIEQVDR